jgi:hypothetical protein
VQSRLRHDDGDDQPGEADDSEDRLSACLRLPTLSPIGVMEPGMIGVLEPVFEG